MGSRSSLEQFIKRIPKAELHVHIEGTFEPELMFQIAKRNGVDLRFETVEQVKDAYDFSNLQDFLDIYYEGAAVLLNSGLPGKASRAERHSLGAVFRSPNTYCSWC